MANSSVILNSVLLINIPIRRVHWIDSYGLNYFLVYKKYNFISIYTLDTLIKFF